MLVGTHYSIEACKNGSNSDFLEHTASIYRVVSSFCRRRYTTRDKIATTLFLSAGSRERVQSELRDWHACTHWQVWCLWYQYGGPAANARRERIHKWKSLLFIPCTTLFEILQPAAGGVVIHFYYSWVVLTVLSHCGEWQLKCLSSPCGREAEAHFLPSQNCGTGCSLQPRKFLPFADLTFNTSLHVTCARVPPLYLHSQSEFLIVPFHCAALVATRMRKYTENGETALQFSLATSTVSFNIMFCLYHYWNLIMSIPHEAHC